MINAQLNDRGRQMLDASSLNRPTKWTGTSSRQHLFGGDCTLDTIVTGHLTPEQLEAYQQHFRIQEITELINASHLQRKPITSLLPLGDLVKNPHFKRDPSPPPTYDKSGTRTNTREARVIADLEKERGYLIEVAAKSIKNFVAPIGYRKQTKTLEKLYIPVKDYPDINFVGLLLGPRGQTLRHILEQSGAKLEIRGKGSVKEGKSISNAADEQSNSGHSSSSFANSASSEDDLHVVITAEFLSSITKAIKLTNEIIEKAISSPEGQNNLKRDQLRQLAVLNGTLRESRPFPIDGGDSRRSGRDISQIVCNTCGRVGHIARDCLMRGQGYHPRVGLGSGVATGTNAAPLPPRNLEKRMGAGDETDLPPWKMGRVEHQLAPPWQQTPLLTPYGMVPPPMALPQPPPAPPEGVYSVAADHATNPYTSTSSPLQPPPPPPPFTSGPSSLPFAKPPPPIQPYLPHEFNAPPPPPPPSSLIQPPPPPPPPSVLTRNPPPPPPTVSTANSKPPPPPKSTQPPPPPPPQSHLP